MPDASVCGDVGGVSRAAVLGALAGGGPRLVDEHFHIANKGDVLIIRSGVGALREEIPDAERDGAARLMPLNPDGDRPSLDVVLAYVEVLDSPRTDELSGAER